MSEDATTTAPETAPPAPVATEQTFGLEYVKSLRDEAASARVSKKDAVDAAVAKANEEWEAKYSAAETEFTALQSDSLGKDATIAKLKAAITAKVPVEKLLDFVDIVKGDTEDEIAESTQKALTLFGGFNVPDSAVDPSQGSGGRPVHALNSDGLLDSLKAAVGAR